VVAAHSAKRTLIQIISRHVGKSPYSEKQFRNGGLEMSRKARLMEKKKKEKGMRYKWGQSRETSEAVYATTEFAPQKRNGGSAPTIVEK